MQKAITAQIDDQSTSGSIERREYSFGERVIRGLKIGGALWFMAVLSVFVPILHFVLVPGFTLLGIIFGWAAWDDKAEVISGEFACPNCKKTNLIERQSESFRAQLDAQDASGLFS